MNPLELAIRREARRHNRQCWLSAASSLFLAWLAWVVAYGFAASIGLLIETLHTGHDAGYPSWLNPWLAGIAAFLLIWAALDARTKRFRLPADRPIVSWHMVPEVVLLPPRLTFAIGDHLAARIRITHHDLAEAARLTVAIADAGRYPAHALAVDFPHGPTLSKALSALQVLRWIDLHKGDEGWFYRLVSERESELEGLRTG